MEQLFNIYCDESCHLEHDHQNIMIIGAIWCRMEKSAEINEQIREIKRRHNMKMSPEFEIKWSKVSLSKKQFYLDIIGYFFKNTDLHFRGLVVTDKDKLNHPLYFQTHDDWYYKMFFHLLKAIIEPPNKYRIYLDYKDSRGSEKINKLKEVLENAKYDFSRTIIERIQLVRSNEVELIQLVDLLIGAISYVNRKLSGNRGKEELVDKIRKDSGYLLTMSTLLREDKMNLFFWNPNEDNK
jgi:hypothetical protein